MKTEPQTVERDQTAALYHLSRIDVLANNPETALRAILDEFVQFFGAHSGSIALLNPDSRALEIEVATGLPVEIKQIQLQLGQGVTGWVALHGKPLLVADVSDDPRYVPVKETIQCEMAAPMMEGDVVAGVINLDHEQSFAWSPVDLDHFVTLAHEATRTVQRIWTESHLRNQAAQLQGVIRLGRQLTDQRDPATLLHYVAAEIPSFLDCDASAIFLYDPKESLLRLASLAGAPDFSDYTEELELEESAIGTVVSRQKQVEVFDLLKTEEHHFLDVVRSQRLLSLLATPIVYENQVIGVLNIYTRRNHRFNNDEKSLALAVASLCAVSLENARLYERVFASEETIRRNERLTTLGLLAAEIAHEIRNPLMVIKLLFDAMGLEFPDEDPRARDVEVIGEKLKQLEETVTRVLNVGKSHGALHARWPLCDIVAETLHLMRLKLEQNRIELSFRRSEEEVIVEASKGQLQQALINLIVNALQAMPNGGRLEVTVSLDKSNQDAPVGAVEIKDTGSGIPEGIQQRIFDSFLSGKAEGTGLGLAITRRILKSHRGDVELVESSESGTRMRFWLPVEV